MVRSMGNPRLPCTIRPIVVSINVRINEALHKRLAKFVARRGTTKKACIEAAVQYYLDNHEGVTDA